MKRSPKRFYRNSSPEVAKQIRKLYFSRAMKQKELGERFGLAQHSISRIVSGQTWAA